MSKQYHTAVVIGRFQGYHNQHLKIIRKAFDLAQNVVVCIGSSNQPRTFKNPFTFKEREDMIRYSLDLSTQQHVGLHFVPIEDSMYNDTAWAVSIQQAVGKIAYDNSRVVLVGHEKDESSYYLKIFKDMWTFHDCGHAEILHAAAIRHMYFAEDCNLNYLVGVVPTNVIGFLTEFKKTAVFQDILKEREYIDNYRKVYANLPYPPVFVTTDAIVIQSGHVLLVKRKDYPGKGLYAFPGGFLDVKNDKTIEDGMIRELYEETNIKLPEAVVRGSIKAVKVFDARGRSARGRVITHAHKIAFSEGEWNLPKVTAADDAAEAVWAPIGSIIRDVMFEDHMDILNWALGR